MVFFGYCHIDAVNLFTICERATNNTSASLSSLEIFFIVLYLTTLSSKHAKISLRSCSDTRRLYGRKFFKELNNSKTVCYIL